MDDKKFMLFGTDLQKIPCFKKTFTYGICTGLAAGLANFIFTSKVKRSSDIAVVSFAVSTVGIWIYCRYNWTREHFLTAKMNSAVHDVMVKQGVKKTDDT
ncbi:cytochrome c oxidase assembly protein COX20, mitochondrial-like [Uloborus diversus]|uniref:cytochrome c oxidase assembly protein COX20, mitochondrial-like n=1 Tax=Uloborus diversus TaxID=327109 RepID=UPI00240A4610|nr:cytochrome c oxidase assembly protein COX20, mitochondrial-like [Uloborus diversus]